MHQSTYLTLNRNGIFSCKKKAPNQCKDIGHTRFKYDLAITCLPKLDEQGFIIDQIELHDIIKAEIEKFSLSCEEYCLKIQSIVLAEFIRRDIRPLSLYIKVRPILTKGSPLRAYMELKTEFI